MKHLQPKEGRQYCNSMRWSPDGQWIAATGNSNHVAYWLACSHHGTYECTLTIWNTDTWKPVGEPRKYPWAGWPVWSPKSNELAIVDRVLKVPDLAERQVSDVWMCMWLENETRIMGRQYNWYYNRTFVADAHGESPLKHSHEAIVECMTVSPDRKSLATSDRHGFIWLWDIASREPLAASKRSPPPSSPRSTTGKTTPTNSACWLPQ